MLAQRICCMKNVACVWTLEHASDLRGVCRHICILLLWLSSWLVLLQDLGLRWVKHAWLKILLQQLRWLIETVLVRLLHAHVVDFRSLIPLELLYLCSHPIQSVFIIALSVVRVQLVLNIQTCSALILKVLSDQPLVAVYICRDLLVQR